MKKFLHEKPWYFAFVAIGFIIQPIGEWLVMYFFDEETVKAWLQKTIAISDIIPWCFGVIIFIACMFVYIIQKNRDEDGDISSDEMDTIKSTLSAAVDDNEYIESMQAFQYRVKNGTSEKYIKLWYVAGEVTERIEVNTILQTYFYFSYSLYKKITIVAGHYDKYRSETDPAKQDDYKTAFCDSGNALCVQILDVLDKIQSTDEIKEHHCDMYRVLARVLPAISGHAIENFLQNRNVENALIRRKKTGILGAMIINDLYIFRNQNSLAKSDRIYFAFPYNAKKKIVFLGAISGSCFPSENLGTLESYCEDIATKLQV